MQEIRSPLLLIGVVCDESRLASDDVGRGGPRMTIESAGRLCSMPLSIDPSWLIPHPLHPQTNIWHSCSCRNSAECSTPAAVGPIDSREELALCRRSYLRRLRSASTSGRSVVALSISA